MLAKLLMPDFQEKLLSFR